MFCKNCGSEVAEGNLFCNNCGAAVEAEPAEEVVTAAPEVVFEAQPEEVFEPAAEPASDPGKALGIVSLICGIAGLVLGTICSCLLSCLGGFGPFCAAVAGIITGVIGMNKSKAAGYKNTMALIGMILSIAAVVIVISFIIINAIIGAINGAANSYYYY